MNCSQKLPNSKFSKGLTLIEMMLVLAIVAVLSIAAFIIYPNVKFGRIAAENIRILNLSASMIDMTFPNGNYARLTTRVACDADVFPDTYKMDPQDCSLGFVSEWQGDINVYGANEDGTPNNVKANYFTVVYDSVPKKVCMRLAALGAASNFGMVGVGQGRADALANPVVNTFLLPDSTLDEALMFEKCATDTATIVFVGKDSGSKF